MLPDELMNELTEAWTTGDRERVERIMKDVESYYASNWMTGEAMDYLMESADRLDVVVERTIEAYCEMPKDQRFQDEQGDLFASFLEEGIRSVVEEDLWEEAFNGTLTSRILNSLADGGAPEFNCAAIAGVLKYRLRDHVAFATHGVPTSSSTALEPVAV